MESATLAAGAPFYEEGCKMASGYTANYRLCQWQPEDQFLREEFNHDNEKIDTALDRAEGKADRALSGLENQSYNIYNLLLQADYEGKETGYKKALLFDGFTDSSRIASKSDALVLGNGKLTLSPSIEADETVYNGGNYQYATYAETTAGTVTAPGGATLSRLYCVWRAKSDNQSNVAITFTFVVNEHILHSEVHRLDFTTTEQKAYIDLQRPIHVAKGDQIYFTCSGLTTYLQMPVIYPSGTRLYAGYVFYPTSGGSVSLTTRTEVLPAWDRLRVWVRHKGGSLALSVSVDGTTAALTPAGTSAVTELQGTSCTESAFVLERSFPAGSVSFLLELMPTSGSAVELFDYGAIFF